MSNSAELLRGPTAVRGAASASPRPLCLPSVPAWVRGLAPETLERALEPGAFGWFEANVPDAASLPERAFETAVRDLYADALALLRERSASPVRIWNYLPNIHAPGTLHATRYEAFCAGRVRGFAASGAGWQTRARAVAGSAVERPGDAFSLHVLACGEGARPVENPRQVSAWRYSARYGVLPPCFSRAAVPLGAAGERVAAIVSGTASIVGEDSRHAGDLAAQLAETLRNLEVIASLTLPERARERPLRAYDALRVYAPNVSLLGGIAAMLADLAPHAQVEVAAARLCRSELLVEIEAVALGRGADACPA